MSPLLGFRRPKITQKYISEKLFLQSLDLHVGFVDM